MAVSFGIDVGGSSIKVGIVKQGGLLIKSSLSVQKREAMETTLFNVAEAYKKLCTDAGISSKEIAAAGMGVPGILNKDTVFCPNLPAWNGRKVGYCLSALLSLPVVVGNDADCAALFEWKKGVLSGCKNAVLLTLGTGIGCGIIANGRMLLEGAGEAGHMVIEKGGWECACGKKGCFEAYCGIEGIKRMATEAGAGEKVEPKDIFERAKQGDPVFQKTAERYLDYLAEGMLNIINLISPERIALGGGMAAAKELIVEGVTKRICGRMIPGKSSVQIVLASAGNDAGVFGAAMLPFQNLN